MRVHTHAQQVVDRMDQWGGGGGGGGGGSRVTSRWSTWLMEDGITLTCRLHSLAGGQSLLPGSSRLHERLPPHVGPQQDDDLSGAACCVSLRSGSSGAAWSCRVWAASTPKKSPEWSSASARITVVFSRTFPRRSPRRLVMVTSWLVPSGAWSHESVRMKNPSFWCVRVFSTSP